MQGGQVGTGWGSGLDSSFFRQIPGTMAGAEATFLEPPGETDPWLGRGPGSGCQRFCPQNIWKVSSSLLPRTQTPSDQEAAPWGALLPIEPAQSSSPWQVWGKFTQLVVTGSRPGYGLQSHPEVLHTSGA